MNDPMAKLELAYLRRSEGVSVAGARSRNPERSEGSRAWLGTRCGSPAIKGKRLCFAHLRARYPQRNGLLPALRDDEAVACAAMQVSRALMEQSLDPRTASLLLWFLQIAKSTLNGEDNPEQE